jgi:hypothetical protein
LLAPVFLEFIPAFLINPLRRDSARPPNFSWVPGFQIRSVSNALGISAETVDAGGGAISYCELR